MTLETSWLKQHESGEKPGPLIQNKSGLLRPEKADSRDFFPLVIKDDKDPL